MDFDSLPQDTPEASPQETPQSFDAMKTDVPKTAFDDLKDDQGKYETPSQQGLTAIEGLGRGATAGLSDALAVGMRKAASGLGVSPENLHFIAPEPENIYQREQANPILSTGSEIAGNIGAMRALPQIGSKAINSMIQMGLISGGDELSKAMLGHGNPMEAAGAHMAESGALGLITGGLFSKAGTMGGLGLKALEDAKVGNRFESFLSGVGHSATFPETGILSLGESGFVPEEISKLHDPSFKAGQGLIAKAKESTKDLSKIIGSHVAGDAGIVAGPYIEKVIGKIAGPSVSKASQKIIGPALLRAAASNKVRGLGQIIDHATTISKGAAKISGGIESLFKAGGDKYLDYENSEQKREKLRKAIENYNIGEQIQNDNLGQQASQNGYAQGGHVSPPGPVQSDSAAEVFPEQNVLLNKTKATISNYLNSVRPMKNHAVLPYDSEIKDPQKERAYDKTLDLANQPMSILKHIKNGTLVPKQVKDFVGMYPDLHSHLSQKITERMAKGKLDEEEKPPHKMRQALSLFLGSNLDSSTTPANIMAAQNVFSQQQAQKQPQKGKQDLSKLGQNLQTPEQSRTARLNKS